MRAGAVRSLAAGAVAIALLASGCTLIDRFDTTEKAACSVAGSARFPLSYLEGPELTPDEFVKTPEGEILDSFFNGGPGEVEGMEYLEADGFSIVSGSLVLGYQNGTPTARFETRGDDIGGWGGCRPVLVRGGETASRWSPVDPIDPAASVLPILVEGGACVEGDEENPEIITEVVAIEVTETDETVEIVAWTREKGFRLSCAGVGAAIDAEALLEQPLGDRTLLDAGLIPAVPTEPGR